MQALVAEFSAIDACKASSAVLTAMLARLHHQVGWNYKLHIFLSF